MNNWPYNYCLENILVVIHPIRTNVARMCFLVKLIMGFISLIVSVF